MKTIATPNGGLSMTDYICVTCNMNCIFDESEYEEYDGVKCPVYKEYVELEELN